MIIGTRILSTLKYPERTIAIINVPAIMAMSVPSFTSGLIPILVVTRPAKNVPAMYPTATAAKHTPYRFGDKPISPMKMNDEAEMNEKSPQKTKEEQRT